MLVWVELVQEMYDVVLVYFFVCQVVIMVVVVVDYCLVKVVIEKIKKKGENLILELVKNLDIVVIFGQQKLVD